MAKANLIPYVVHTEQRMVFFGYAEKEYDDSGTIRLTQCRMCVYWSQDVRGVPGLAANGPGKGCRVSPAAPSGRFSGVFAAYEASEAAVKAWEAAPWN